MKRKRRRGELKAPERLLTRAAPLRNPTFVPGFRPAGTALAKLGGEGEIRKVTGPLQDFSGDSFVSQDKLLAGEMDSPLAPSSQLTGAYPATPRVRIPENGNQRPGVPAHGDS